MRARLLAISTLILGCVEGDDKDQGPDPWNDPIDGDYPVDLIECASQPSPRRHHQVAAYVEPDLLSYNVGSVTRRTERGFLVYGGESISGTPLDDLWLYDLSRPWEQCPWTRLSTDATIYGGVADGALAYDAISGDFRLVGGRFDQGLGWQPLQDVLRLDSLGTTFNAEPSSGLATQARVVTVGSPACQMQYATCVCASPSGCGTPPGPVVSYGEPVSTWVLGDGTQESHRRAVCDGQAGSASWHAGHLLLPGAVARLLFVYFDMPQPNL